jgi:2-polyprenyl-3-methyl-5-hydroxy-6-metoxy-1,4-benzoquinol methylase
MKDKITWEETIQYIRTKPEYKFLVEKAYFEKELSLNVERFKESEEFLETLELIKQQAPNAENILDVGSGNGISAVAFALMGFQVLATEPDASDTIGAGAIRKLKTHYQLSNLEVVEEFAENLHHKGASFDVIYVRQAMHHAFDLDQFIFNLSSLLKKDGILLTARDHVIFDEKDKTWFLETHPLQKYYGGENAFTEVQYKKAFKNAGLIVIKHLKHYQSVINYFPLSKEEYSKRILDEEKRLKDTLVSKIGFLGNFKPIITLYKLKNSFSSSTVFNEINIPGRMHTFLTKKK